ncbi:hypothetical protein [Elizabethkingia sp. JS20170427COW]|uniref:hypothetical protein n=1 Tax=Elizabethkingia sp. JS20170427COW TaxID=2583851 RepID=UPI0011101966|nr:hypothetical protein [Elizabethkingia sp. JS20170427COW]QCX52431.1 hypothetical protein FGE20_01045 [Elizabethkingia sp. JS20170427COW]
MREKMWVPVYEGELLEEVEKLKRKLEENEISTELEKGPMSFPFSSENDSFKLKVEVHDEAKAFQIIDDFFNENTN